MFSFCLYQENYLTFVLLYSFGIRNKDNKFWIKSDIDPGRINFRYEIMYYVFLEILYFWYYFYITFNMW